MAKVIVLGAGVCGLATALLLARDGHEVSVLERDRADPPAAPGAAWEQWQRPGVAQFRQPHFLLPRVRDVLDRELPDVREALLAAGAARSDPLDRMPADLGGRRPGDERLVSLTARRPVLELVLATIAEAQPNLLVRRGVDVTGVTERVHAGIPHVTGVRTAEGSVVTADVVVDATGRGSKLARWLADAGAAPLHEEAEDCGFLYYTRFFRSRDGSTPEVRTIPLLTPVGSFSILTLPGDGKTWSVTLFTSSGDSVLKRAKDAGRWTSVVAACPLHAHWLDGEPLTDVLPMAGVVDRYRRLSHDGHPVATGVCLVADAWACTNPSLARGIGLGLSHAARLRDVLREHPDDPSELARVWDAVTESEFTPWYRATVAVDRARLAEIEAIRRGVAPASPADAGAAVRARLPLAAARDPDLFRALFEIVGCLTLPSEVLARPGLAERVLAVTEDPGPPRVLGPTRAELEDLLTR
jgi:2-polyprenyl-6-methoxyphenol hydroxylase-like FAD-dependent oxidoreductase